MKVKKIARKKDFSKDLSQMIVRSEEELLAMRDLYNCF